MAQDKEYFAFISYKREDEKWAKWLANELEHYHLPTTLNGKELPKNLRPIFRDVEELSAGNLPEQIYHALSNSKNLIVVCSPRSAKSEWVNKEIEDFIKIKGGKADNIYPFIIEGVPFSKDEDRECYPEKLRNLPDNEEKLGGNINETGGKNVAVVKTIAGMLGVSHDSLWNRFEREQRKKRKLRIATVIMLFICISGIACWMYWQNKQTQMANWEMMENQSRIVAEKALELVNKGDSYLARLLLLEVLPKDLKNPERPCVPEVEAALRRTIQYNNAIFRGHNLSVLSVLFSPSGKRIISSSGDCDVKIWDLSTGQCLKTHEGCSHFTCPVLYSPDGKYYISALWNHLIYKRDTISGHQYPFPLKGHTGDIHSISYSPDGYFLVSASADSTIRIWENHSGHCLKVLQGHEGIVNSALFSPDGKRLVSSSFDKTIRIWNVEKGYSQRVLGKHQDIVRYASFSPDGKLIVSASDDSTIKMWEAETGRCVRTLIGHKGVVNSVLYSNDGKRLLSSSSDGTIKLWNAKTGNIIQTIEEASPVYYATFDSNDKYVAAALWDNTIRIHGPISCQKIVTLKGHKNAVCSSSYSPDGKKIISASLDSCIRIWDTANGKCLQNLSNYSQRMNYASFSPDGKKAYSISDSIINIWDLSNGRCLKSYTENYLELAVSPAWRYIAFYKDDSVCIKDFSSGRQIQVLEDSGCWCLTFSPDERYLALASVIGGIKIFDISLGNYLPYHFEGHSSSIESVSFSSDSKYMASSSNDCTIRIWNLDNGKCLHVLEGHSEKIGCVSYSPDDKYVASSSDDGTIKIWDVASGYCLQTFEGHLGPVNYVSFCPTNHHVVSASSDGTINIWDFPPLQQLIDETRERFKDRKLTPEERRKYYIE